MVFSVIIPVYNVEPYLRQCLDSVLIQRFQDFELILVDDGSTDSSGQICDAYAQMDPRISVIHKSNGGQSTARNEGLRHAQGDYIVFLDSDDFYIHEHVLSQIAEKCDSQPDIVCFKYKKYFHESGVYGTCGYTYGDIQTDSYCSIIGQLIDKDAFFCSAWSKAVRRSVLMDHNIRFDENSRCEDMDWYFSVISHSGTMALADDVMVAYRQRKNSVTSVKSSLTIDHFLAFLQKWTVSIEKLTDQEFCAVLRHALAKLFSNLMIAYCSLDGNLQKGRYLELKKFASLLEYHRNPRVKKIWILRKILGFRTTLNLLGFAIKMR